MKKMLWMGAALIGFGCASHPPPVEMVASSAAATQSAEEAGALLVPEAALHLQLAQEQLAQAKQLIQRGENTRAEWLAARAREDADLATAIAREQDVKRRLDMLARSSAGGEHSESEPGANPPSGQPNMNPPSPPAGQPSAP